MGRNWFSQALKRMTSVAIAGLLLLPAAASAAPPPLGGLTQLPGQLGCLTTVASASCGLATGIDNAERGQARLAPAPGVGPIAPHVDVPAV